MNDEHRMSDSQKILVGSKVKWRVDGVMSRGVVTRVTEWVPGEVFVWIGDKPVNCLEVEIDTGETVVGVSEQERLVLLLAIANMSISCPDMMPELRVIADKFGGLRGWELIENTNRMKEMSYEGCTRQ